VLDGVLGIGDRPEHVPAETKDAGAVAVVEDLECDRIARADVLGEPLVRDCREEAPGLGQT